MYTFVEQLVSQISDQIRTLRERDGVAINDDQACERARNIVTVLLGLYEIRPLAAVTGQEGLARDHA